MTTDDDFVAATRHVKVFKTAEKSLKDAKQSAIDQAADIQRLFASIDEISEEARQARLSLERQIKARKIEIKEGFIQSGIESVRAFIGRQGEDFQMMDHSAWLDRNRFISAAKRKAGARGVQSAIDGLCGAIELEISQKAAEVTDNGATIDVLPDRYRLLFQDRKSLLSLTKKELDLTVDKRIALFNEENTRIKAEKAINDLKKLEDVELNPDTGGHPGSAEILEKEKYRLIMDILSTKETAIEIARSIRQAHGDNASILSIRLTRNHD